MKKIILTLAICAFAAPMVSLAQSTNMAPPAVPTTPPPLITTPAAPEAPAETNAPAKPKKVRTTLSVTGKAVTVDTNAMTITLGKHTYDITSETRITKDGKPATLSEVTVGNKIGITYKKSGDKLDALTVTDGKKAE